MYWSKFVISLLIGIVLCKVSQVDAACNPVGAFTCDNGDCIPIRNHCDNDNDCSDGTDETTCDSCLENEIQCDSYCIPQTWQCDGVQDCQDGSDEADCTECNEWAFTCTSNGACQPKSATCNGTTECDDGEDEQDCSGSCDEEHDFTCHNGECTQQCYVCDGERDCSDGSDEEDCDMFALTGLLCFADFSALDDISIPKQCPASACTPFHPLQLQVSVDEDADIVFTAYNSLGINIDGETATVAANFFYTFSSLKDISYVELEINWRSRPGNYELTAFTTCSQHHYCDYVLCEI